MDVQARMSFESLTIVNNSMVCTSIDKYLINTDHWRWEHDCEVGHLGSLFVFAKQYINLYWNWNNKQYKRINRTLLIEFQFAKHISNHRYVQFIKCLL